MFEDFDFDDHNMQNDFDTDETWASVSLSFNPYHCSLSALEVSCHLSKTFRVNCKNFVSKIIKIIKIICLPFPDRL